MTDVIKSSMSDCKQYEQFYHNFSKKVINFNLHGHTRFILLKTNIRMLLFSQLRLKPLLTPSYLKHNKARIIRINRGLMLYIWQKNLDNWYSFMALDAPIKPGIFDTLKHTRARTCDSSELYIFSNWLKYYSLIEDQLIEKHQRNEFFKISYKNHM